MSALMGTSDDVLAGTAAAAGAKVTPGGGSVMGTDGVQVRRNSWNSFPEKAIDFIMIASDSDGFASPRAAVGTTIHTARSREEVNFTTATSPLTPTTRGWSWGRRQQSVKNDGAPAVLAGRVSPKKMPRKVQRLRLRQLIDGRASSVDTLVSPIETSSSQHRPGSFSPRPLRIIGDRAHSVKVTSTDHSNWNSPDGNSRRRRSTGERLLPSPWKRSSEPPPSPAYPVQFGVVKPAAGGESSEAARAGTAASAVVAETVEVGKTATVEKSRISGVSAEPVMSLRNVRRLWERRASCSCDDEWDELQDAAEKQKDSRERESGRHSSTNTEKGLGVGSLKVR